MRTHTWMAVLPVVLGTLAGSGCRQPERGALAWRGAAAEGPDGRAATAMPGANASARRLWAGSFIDFYLTSVSPDGRWVTWKDWSTGDLLVRDLHTDAEHRVTHNPRDGIYREAHTGVFSRDGRRIAYAWEEATGDVRVVDFDGTGAAPRVSEPRVVYDNPLQYPYYLWDWSPDGRWVLGKLYGADNTTITITLFSSTGEPARTLKTFDWREPLRAAFSPDGRYVAYDLPSASDRRIRHIFVVSLDGTRERIVVGGAAHNRLFAWDAGGGILYLAQGDGAPALWRQPVADGQAAGAPQLLRDDLWRADPIGIAGSALFFGVAAELATLHLVDLDLAAGRPAGAARPVIEPFGGDARSMAWSPDGQHLAALYRDVAQRGRRLVVHGADGSAISELALDLESWIGRLRWFPDGRSILLFGRDERGRLGFYRVNLETGARDVVLRTEAESSSGLFALSPDGATLYFGRLEEPDDVVMVARELATGVERRIASVAWPGIAALSPDGTELATTTGTADSVAVTAVAVTGGAPREVFRLRGRWTLGSMHWTPDGGHVLFVAQQTESPWDSDVWLVPVRGGEATKLDGIAPDFRNAVLHPNGRRLAYKTGQNRGEIWVLELGATAPTAALPAAR